MTSQVRRISFIIKRTLYLISYLSLLILVVNGGSVYLTYWAMQISEHSQPSYIIGR